MPLYKNYVGPQYPIHQVTGTEVLNPFDGDRITENEAMKLLLNADY